MVIAGWKYAEAILITDEKLMELSQEIKNIDAEECLELVQENVIRGTNTFNLLCS